MALSPITLAKIRTIKVDPPMLALLACSANVIITAPSITRALCAADRLVYGRKSGETAFNLLIAELGDIFAKIDEIAAAVGLTAAEVAEVKTAITAIMDHETAPDVKLSPLPGRARFVETT